MLLNQSVSNLQGFGYLEGKYVPISEMCLPVMDLGFQLSDMCYDALHVYKGRYFRIEEHLDRFEWAIAERQYNNLNMDRKDFKEIFLESVSRSGLRESMVTIVATRGIPTNGDKDLRTCKNRLMVWALPYYSVVTAEEVENGCDIIISQTTRIPSESVDPRIKNYGRLDFVHATLEAYDRDARYALLLDRDGNVTEGRGWNIFALHGGRLISPDKGVLEGITRQTVVELAESLNIEACLENFSANELYNSDEIFLTSTAGGIIPVRSVDGENIGDGEPGPVTSRLSKMYWKIHEDDAFSTIVPYRE